MKNNIINELKFASKKKKNAGLGYVYCNYLLDMFEEIERLNNNWNELEKYIKESCWKDDWGVESIYVKTLLNKLQELKGSDKE